MKAKKMQAGISASTPAAIIWPQSTENLETKVKQADREGHLLLAVDQHQREQQLRPGGGEHEARGGPHARQGQRKDRSGAAPAKRVQPSIIADSSSSLGMPSKNDCIRKVANGTLKAV